MLNRKSKLAYIFLFCIICILTGCAYEERGNQDISDNNSGYSEFVPALPGNYDSLDTATIISIDKKNNKIQFKTFANNKFYTLSYDGATCFYDKYDQPLMVDQVVEGEIVDVAFMKDRKRLDKLSLSKESFIFTDNDNYLIYDGGHKIAIGEDVYSVSDDIEVFSEGKRASLIDLNEVDILGFRGFNHTIESIVVERGHGYLRLVNAESFIGGFVSVSDKKVFPVEDDDMLYTVPSGTYVATISGKDSSGSEEITVESDQEYEWDVKKWQGEEKKGWILFIVNPDDASVFIDKNKVNFTDSIELTYGIHQLIVVKSGYKTISKYIKVGAPSAEININMETEDASENSVISGNDPVEIMDASVNDISSNEVSLNDISENDILKDNNKIKEEPGKKDISNNDASDGLVPDSVFNDSEVIDGVPKVNINAPDGAEVYVDGKYVGIAPVSFKKKSGTIVISLRKNGCQTRSYTLEIDESDADVNYSFSELLEI